MFRFIAERNMLHKVLKVSLQDCWKPHKGCLGATCGFQNCGWEALLWSRVSNSNCSVGHMRTNEVTHGLHYDPDTTMVDHELPRSSFYMLISCEIYHEL